MCVASWDDIDGGRESTDAMMAIADFFSGIRDAVTAAGGMTALDQQQEMFAHMKDLQGFPVSSKSFDDAGALRRGPGESSQGRIQGEEMDRFIVSAALERTDHNVTAAARILGTTRQTLRYRVQKYGLTSGDDGQ